MPLKIDIFIKHSVELHLSRLTGTKIHLDKQKIRIIGFSFQIGYIWQFEV